MASQRSPGCSKSDEGPVKSAGQLGQTLRSTTVTNSNPHTSTSSGQPAPPLAATQRLPNVPPGNDPENSLIVREALRMNLPRHLVLGSAQRRVQTHGANYTDMKELVADLFAPDDRSDQEVPMATDQLEEAVMMNSPVVKKALRMGAPPHLIKPKVRAKILSNEVGYTDVSELLKDVNYK